MSLIERITQARIVLGTDYLPLAGALFGFVLWLLSFYVVAPLAGWTQFSGQTNPFVQVLAFTVFFGCPLGWMLGQSRASIIRQLVINHFDSPPTQERGYSLDTAVDLPTASARVDRPTVLVIADRRVEGEIPLG